MKKILLIATMAATLTGLSALGQGNFIFGTGGSVVWNSSTQTRGGAFNVGFLWGSGTPLVDSIRTFTPTNSSPAFDSASAWSSILNDPNFTFAQNSTAGAVAVGTLSPAGGVAYNAGGNFLVTGTSANGGTVNLYMVAWSNLYATPALAAAANSPLGWSIPFAYTYAANPGAASGNFSTAAVGDGVGIGFGVATIPEPTTFALAGLGAAALMVFRRRNSK